MHPISHTLPLSLSRENKKVKGPPTCLPSVYIWEINPNVYSHDAACCLYSHNTISVVQNNLLFYGRVKHGENIKITKEAVQCVIRLFIGHQQPGPSSQKDNMGPEEEGSRWEGNTSAPS